MPSRPTNSRPAGAPETVSVLPARYTPCELDVVTTGPPSAIENDVFGDTLMTLRSAVSTAPDEMVRMSIRIPTVMNLVLVHVMVVVLVDVPSVASLPVPSPYHWRFRSC